MTMRLFMSVPLLLLRQVSESADSMLHSVWSPTTDICSLASAPVTEAYKVSVDRTVNLLELTDAKLADSGHAFVFPNGDVQVKTP